ncbi:targeting protein for Xklp2 [Contarinia nasturtii]|uniref:targeting protein for Xklp2 n=1 Tax=Contarinia nasturtii TaxID=265458 RepID=UPI0012D3969C|nr:targeting protein for Xklp2 [Contarinia nasturtii]
MQRFLNNYGKSMEESDSLVTNDYNWEEISFGDDTIAAERFFAVKHPEHERKKNIVNIEFEETTIEPNENDENQQNYGQAKNPSNSVESENILSSLGEIQIDSSPAQKQKTNGIRKGVKPLCAQNQQLVPNVVRIGELYEQKKKIRYEQLLQQEREQRKFHAKPVPNFAAIHAASSKKRESDEPKVTVPKTPRVVHTHRKNIEIIRKKQQEIEEANKIKPFVSKEADVLFKAPFMPQQKKKTPISVSPFNLHSDERLRERRQFDQQVKEEKERKEKEEEERRKQLDDQLRKEIRKATTFKANPNPFS